nr:dna polymerase zeta catalytic subunit [Quercus suber]
MDKPADVFRVRLNCVDYYQTTPSALDPALWGPHITTSTQRSNLPQVPIIRVFGSTETGQKVCAHIHGALPYLYIPYLESIEKASVDEYIDTLRHSIDHALALSYRRNPYDDPRKVAFVAHITLVKGVPFFGYNVGYKYYLKIYLLNPRHMTRFTELLQQGAILKRIFQPYEAHLEYLLQWMCDFNLYGCAYIETTRPHFRRPVPEWEDLEDPTHRWHSRSIDADQLLDEDRFQRQSHCQLELDIRVEDILNRHEVQSRELHHSFIERLASLEDLPPEEKLVNSMAGLWKDESRRRKLRMGLTDPSSSPFPPEVLVSMSADPRNTNDGGWIHEEEFRSMVGELSKQERKSRGGQETSFDSFIGPQQKDNVQTVFQSVEALFEDRLASVHKDKFRENEATTVGAEPFRTENDTIESELLVDTTNIAALGEASDDYGSDEDVARTKALTQRQKLKDARMTGSIPWKAYVEGSAADIAANAAQIDEDVKLPVDKLRFFQQDSGTKRTALNSQESPAKRIKLNDRGERPVSRHVSFTVLDDQPAKPSGFPHSRNTERDTPSDVAHAHYSAIVGQQTIPSAQPPPSSQRSSQSSQGNRLFFPVVKKGDESEIALRLSQRDELAHLSQRDTRHPRKDKDDSATSSGDSTKFSSSTSASKALSSQERLASQNSFSVQLCETYGTTFRIPRPSSTFVFAYIPPTWNEVQDTLSPSVIYQDAYYSLEKDVPERPREYAGQEFKLTSNTLPYLPAFDASGPAPNGATEKPKTDLAEQSRKRQCSLRNWEIMQAPPTWQDVQSWLELEGVVDDEERDDLDVDGPPPGSQLKRKNRPAPELSQIDGPTQRNKHGYKFSQKKKSTSVKHETGYMSTMSLEVHVNTRGDLAPDPERDEVAMIVWCRVDEQLGNHPQSGVLVLDKDVTLLSKIQHMVGGQLQVVAEDNELDLFNHIVDIVREYDPDILTGYEVHNGSWGFLIERARLQYEFNLPDEFSRMKSQSHGRFGKDADRWGFTQTSTVRITGRHTINIWRAMRSELNLLQYTMENVVFHLLHRRIPHYSFADLTRWYQSKNPRDLARVLDYITTRTQLDHEVLEANELINRTSEQARLLGVDFFSVFSRGSQFKVESLMFRIAKPESFVLVSPSRKQVGAQNALECLPLVMEPQSAFYSSPLLVLDFQSLYPSVMIAYNYCYSTCLGRIVNWRGTNKLGFADFERAPGLLEVVKDKLNIAPNGMMYVKPEMRKSLLAKMLGEILETRVMVKSGMKVDKDDKTLQQLLNNRQLALKLIANVTYGYTSASFSGRMPCSEVADSIVQTGRETLEKAIALIHSVTRWGAEVVYGDTDSLFVYLKGRTRDDAFKIGDEIAKAVTNMNPRPVKLKFEKVYHPCVLLAKKRYVGFKYESPTQTEPEFDAKGIETVRRDGTPAEQKIEEKALKLLFRTSDLSAVKRYFQAQCHKIMTGRFSVQDFCFAKEVKLGTYADKGPPPPGALIATKRMLRDPRTEPQHGERIPYVVIAGAPGARLWERCVEPERLLHDAHAELDAEYYISKNLIPPLERIFNLVGANVRQWYDEMPKPSAPWKATWAARCVSSAAANWPPTPPPCPSARTAADARPHATLLTLRQRVARAERTAQDLRAVCRSCAGLAPPDAVRCDSRDCPVFYSRVKAEAQLGGVRAGVERVLEALQETELKRAVLEW